jgi:prepilin-type N-terminal cleavage/methylation domain-containing protein/prepilin-type processing-associated H-X9-DG protein
MRAESKRLVGENTHHSQSKAFSLVEILIVIGIIAVLAALASPAVNKALKAGRDGKSLSNLRQVAAMVNSYVADSGGLYPPDTDPPYCNRLYPYLAPGQPVPPSSESNAKLAGTVFVSPGMTMALLKKHNYHNSFSGQYVLRQVYGINGKLQGSPFTVGGRAVRLSKPSATCLLMSSPGPRADTVRKLIDVGAEAYDGFLHVAFADGHVERIPEDKIPRDASGQTNRMFWIGLE